jgi:hypothetical protein
MNAKLFRVTSVALVLNLISGAAATAVSYNPSEADFDALADVTTVFGATQLSTIDAVDTSGPGTTIDVSWRIGPGGLGGETFSRVVLQRPSFDADLSALDSLDLVFEPDHAGVGVKPFVQTGSGFAFFETPFIGLPANTPTIVSLDLTGLPDTNNVRQFGFQLFGPAPAVGQTIQGSIRISAVPEPTCTAVAALGVLVALGARWVRG